MTEQEYRKLFRISYSKLSGLDASPASLISTKETWNDGIQFGSIVDMLIFDGEEKFNEQFCTVSMDNISKFLQTVIEEIVIQNNPFGGNSFPPLKDCKSSIEKACKIHNYGQTWKEETRLNKVLECEKYYLNLKKCLDKRVVDTNELADAKRAVSTLLTHSFTKNYFVPREGVEIHTQLPILWEYKGLECKSLFDMLIIDHNNKTIQVCDLKTTSYSSYAFKSSFLEWKYYLQAAFYTEALIEAANDNSLIQREGIVIPNHYSILPFDFVVIGKNSLDRPIVWRTSEEWMKIGKEGNDKVKGFSQLVDDYLWHLDNGLYDYHRNVYESNGILTINYDNE